jgi:hypothetical protein
MVDFSLQAANKNLEVEASEEFTPPRPAVDPLPYGIVECIDATNERMKDSLNINLLFTRNSDPLTAGLTFTHGSTRKLSKSVRYRPSLHGTCYGWEGLYLRETVSTKPMHFGPQ